MIVIVIVVVDVDVIGRGSVRAGTALEWALVHDDVHVHDHDHDHVYVHARLETRTPAAC